MVIVFIGCVEGNDKKTLPNDYEFLGYTTLPRGEDVAIYYSSSTDLMVYAYSNGYRASYTPMCLSTLPEPYQSNLRKQLGLLN
jgi:hypothetical protein